MSHVTIPAEYILNSDSGQTAAGLAFDGCYFYLLDDSVCQVSKYSLCFEYIGTINTCRIYSCLCFAGGESFFWAASRECPNILFKLNNCFQEVEEVHILPNNKNSGYITGLSFNCRCKTLLIAFTWGVLEFNSATEASSLFYEPKQGIISGVLSIYPGCVITQSASGRQTVIALNQYNQPVQQQLVPPGSVLRQIIYYPCDEDPVFCALLNGKNGGSRIVSKSSSCSTLGFNIDSCYKDAGKNCRMPDITKCDFGFDKADALPEIASELLKGFSSVGGGIGGCRKTLILESIALTGTAISHILNAEGEKLQKVLACTDDIPTILCVNREVNRTIISITHLEQVLYEKQTALEDLCCDKMCCRDCCRDKCCDDRCRDDRCCDDKCRDDRCRDDRCRDDRCRDDRCRDDRCRSDQCSHSSCCSLCGHPLSK